jgi:hypothetical protein
VRRCIEMSTSADSDRDSDRATTTLVPSATRYDLLLAVVPAVFLVGVVASHLASLPPRTGLAGASLVAGLAVVDALFRNPPLSE